MSSVWLGMQAERRRAAEAAAETEAAAHAQARRLVLEKQLQQESDLQQVTTMPTHACLLACLHTLPACPWYTRMLILTGLHTHTHKHVIWSGYSHIAVSINTHLDMKDMLCTAW